MEPGSTAEKNGLKRADEIIEVNGQPFRSVPLNKALDVLRESTHLSMTIKSNMMGFKDMLSKQEQGGKQFLFEPLTYHISSGTGTMGRFQKKSSLGEHGRRMTTNPLPSGNSSTKVTTPKHANPSIIQSNNHKSTMLGKIRSVFKNNDGIQEIDLATDSGEVSDS